MLNVKVTACRYLKFKPHAVLVNGYVIVVFCIVKRKKISVKTE
jgi:hypothetical protein